MPAETCGTKIRVMLVDDHILVRMGLSFAVNNQPDMQVVAQAEDGNEAIEMYRKHRPDVVLLDLRMPKRNGFETIGLLRKESGAVRILVLSNYGGGDEISAALQGGARGFVGKDAGLGELLSAIRLIHAGEQVIPPDVARRLASRISSQLSPRELEVLTLIGRGLSNKQIGSALNVVESTVKVHVTNILTKLGVSDRTQAILAAIKRGIVQVD
ncbi:MAG TPA: response regulator transcription factor [Opitutaceae bacterium]|nr:response regulator transcription factor [Opitutaceae bacterium]